MLLKNGADANIANKVIYGDSDWRMDGKGVRGLRGGTQVTSATQVLSMSEIYEW